jgi:thiol-disulfide isomerase/thioredoxin
VGLSSSIFAQGIEFFHGSWPEALAKAKSEEKLIFVDAFASWCGPCKRMAKESFPDPKVGEVYNASFICLKIDMEKPENAEFAGKYPVNSYPTLIEIAPGEFRAVWDSGDARSHRRLIRFGKLTLEQEP